MRENLRPDIAEPEIAGRTFEETYSQLIFKLGHTPAHGRDRHLEPSRRFRKTPRFDHFREDGQRVQVSHSGAALLAERTVAAYDAQITTSAPSGSLWKVQWP